MNTAAPQKVDAPAGSRWTSLKGGMLAWVLAAVAVLGFGYLSMQLREARLTEALEQTRLHAVSLEDSLTQSLRVIELTMSQFDEGSPTDLADVAGNQQLLQAIRSLPHIRSLSLTDSSGRIFRSSNPQNIGSQVNLDALFPPGSIEAPQLRVGTPVQGRDWHNQHRGLEQDQPPFIPLARTWANRGASYWMVAALNSDQFIAQAHALMGESEMVATWTRYDGAWLWSTNPTDTPAKQLPLTQQMSRWIADTEASTWEWAFPGGPGPLLLSYRSSSRFPMALAVTWSKQDALEPWTNRTQTGLMVLLPLVLGLCMAGWWLASREQQLRQKQAELDEEHELATKVFGSSSNAILVTAPDGSIVWVNPAFERLTGYGAEEVRGKNPRLLGSGQHSRDFFEAVWVEILSAGRWRGTLTNQRRNGELYRANVTINAIRSAHGPITHLAGVLQDVTEEERLQHQLRDSEERMSLALAGGGLAYWDRDLNTNQVLVNPRWTEMLGLPHESVIPWSKWFNALHPDDREEVLQTLQNHLDGRTAMFSAEYRLRHSAGHWVWVMDSGRVTSHAPDGKPLRMVGTHLDISQRKLAEEQTRLAASVFSHAQEAIMITDPQGTLLDVNQGFERITGYQREDVLGKNTSLLSSGRQDKAFYQAMWQELSTAHRWTGEIWNRRKSGEVFAELLTISSVRNAKGQVERYVALFSDITKLKTHEHELERIAHFDALTGLPNRVLLGDRLQQAMEQSRRNGCSVAVVFLDLDGFKLVNDTHGHAAGDHLLVQLAHRMKEALRSGDSAARVGGDEFVFVLQGLTDHQSCIPVLERLRDAASSIVPMGELEFQVSASIGLAFYPQTQEVGPEQLLRQADQAMYQAKLSGKNRYHVFDAHQDRLLRDRHENLGALSLALRTGQFELYYQPKVNMRSGEVVGMEALLRWNHPERGVLAPGAFLPELEGQGLALELGDWVLDRAVEQTEAWKSMGLSIPVSVNLDAQQLQGERLIQRLNRLLVEYPTLKRGDLRLEVLETSALHDIQQVSDLMTTCEQLGVDFALDDFGTGYSSLTYLRRLPARELKIDQSFVRDMLDDSGDLAILQGVLGLAEAFQREVIAEGVETVAHGRMLLRMGCHMGQGYAIARPMPAHEVPDWCGSWQPDPSWRATNQVSSDDLPVLFAIAEHRGWMRSLRAHLDGEKQTPPPLSPTDCAFGQWLHQLPPIHRLHVRGDFDRVHRLHNELHRLAGNLNTLVSVGEGDRIRNEMWLDLEQASQQLVNELLTWLDNP